MTYNNKPSKAPNAQITTNHTLFTTPTPYTLRQQGAAVHCIKTIADGWIFTLNTAS